MYAYAQKYDEHKDKLRRELSDQEVRNLNFEPKLNPNSVRLVKETQKNFTDRTMGQYLNKHNRQDRDPN